VANATWVLETWQRVFSPQQGGRAAVQRRERWKRVDGQIPFYFGDYLVIED
jgi:hypothetical protein